MGDLKIGSLTVKDPSAVAAVGAAYWQQVMLNERHVQYDEHTYPGYDIILTKNLGSRETTIVGSLALHYSSEALCESAFQTAQTICVDSINDLTTPHGTAFARVRCMKFQGSRMYKWVQNGATGYLMFVEFAFRALQAQSGD